MSKSAEANKRYISNLSLQQNKAKLYNEILKELISQRNEARMKEERDGEGKRTTEYMSRYMKDNSSRDDYAEVIRFKPIITIFRSYCLC